jgi:hypothetical protein
MAPVRSFCEDRRLAFGSSLVERGKIMTLLKPNRGRWFLLAALIPIALAVQSVLAQDLDDDSALNPTAIPHEEVTFRKKMTVTLSPYSSCDSGAVCLQLQGSSGVGEDSVTVTGNFQMTDCAPRGMQTCCNTSGSDFIDTNGILGFFSMDYSGLTCSESDSQEMFQGPTVAYIGSGWGKGTRRLTFDLPTGDFPTGTGTLSMLDYLHVPRPPSSHRCGTQRCYSKGCCNGGCCFVCTGPRCP